MEKVLLRLYLLVAGCTLCSGVFARDGVGSGSSIGGRSQGSHFGLGGFLSSPKKERTADEERSAAAGASAEKKDDKDDKDDKKPPVKKITITK